MRTDVNACETFSAIFRGAGKRRRRGGLRSVGLRSFVWHIPFSVFRFRSPSAFSVLCPAFVHCSLITGLGCNQKWEFSCGPRSIGPVVSDGHKALRYGFPASTLIAPLT